MATNFLNRILIASAADASELTAPAAGSNISSISGWTAIGSVARGDSADLDADSVEITFYDVYGEILPPVALVKSDVVPLQNGVESFSFVCYDASETLLTLASDITVTGNAAQKTLTSVKRSVTIEVNGLFYDYFPNVELCITGVPVGIAEDGASRTQFMGRVCAGATITSGWKRKWYQ